MNKQGAWKECDFPDQCFDELGKMYDKQKPLKIHSSFFKLHFVSAIPGMQCMPEADKRN